MRKICVYTGTRAEYGLLYWLLTECKEDPEIDLQLIVSGSHLLESQGYTVQIIENDGFNISAKIEMYESDTSSVGLVRAMARSLSNLSDTLEHLKPDLAVVLGDRYEIQTFAQACMMFNIPLAHIHGGEATEGLIDDAVRHSVTKMAHIHFPSTEIYKKRIELMGENPDRIFNFGAPGIDNITKLKLLKKKELFEQLDLEDRETFLITYHPVTLYPEKSQKEFSSLLEVIDILRDEKDFNFVFTLPNVEHESEEIVKQLKAFCTTRPDTYLFKSLGQLRYLSLVKESVAVVGNSSSGIIEVPYFNIPTIDIGERQRGRVAGPSVLNVSSDVKEMLGAFKKCFDQTFLNSISHSNSLYGRGGASKKIKNVLKKIDLEDILYKPFHNSMEGV